MFFGRAGWKPTPLIDRQLTEAEARATSLTQSNIHSCLTTTMTEPVPEKQKSNWYPPWAPRFWNGMLLSDYYRLMRENRFQVHPYKYAMATLSCGCAVMNSALAGVQRLTHGRKIAAAVKLPRP